MSMASLERAILAGARVAFNNKGLKADDILEWSTGEVKPRDGEVALWIDDPGVYVCIKVALDKRPAD